MGGSGEDDRMVNGVHPQAPTSTDSVRLAALEITIMSVIPGAVSALVRLNIFQALAQAGDDAELTAPELAELALPGKSINLSYLGRLLRLMSGKKVLREVVTTGDDGAPEFRYALAPIGRFLTTDAENGSFVHLLLNNQDPGSLQTWEHIHESVLDDNIPPFARAHGMSVWEYAKQNPEYGKNFNNAMSGLSTVYVKGILNAYHGFEEVKVLVDVGGGSATSLSLITARYPHIKGINFDQPHVIDACPELPGVEHVSGNMFESVPSGGDAIFMKLILHDWDDESCVKILQNCYRALPADGKVIVVDCVLPDIIDFAGGDHMALHIDIQMLAFSATGSRERTERDVRKLGLAAGFKQVKLICKVDDAFGVIEFHKA